MAVTAGSFSYRTGRGGVGHPERIDSSLGIGGEQSVLTPTLAAPKRAPVALMRLSATYRAPVFQRHKVCIANRSRSSHFSLPIQHEGIVMVALMDEYLAEIRSEVCSRCVERPPGGPPCLPLGKRCGVELHLKEIVDLVQTTGSPCMEPYVEHLHSDVCAYCQNKVTKDCPCALDYLLPLVVEAIENIDARHGAVS